MSASVVMFSTEGTAEAGCPSEASPEIQDGRDCSSSWSPGHAPSGEAL